MAEEPKIQFAAGTLKGAQEAKHLGDKDVVKELGGLSVRTWQRWKADDAVPRTRCLAVVLLLGLPQPDNLDDDVPRTPWVILEALEGVSRGIEELVAALREISARLPRDPNQH